MLQVVGKKRSGSAKKPHSFNRSFILSKSYEETNIFKKVTTLYCPECSEIPKIKVIPSDNLKLEIECHCSTTKQLAKNFLEKQKKIQAQILCHYCGSKNKELGIGQCSECRVFLCKSCAVKLKCNKSFNGKHVLNNFLFREVDDHNSHGKTKNYCYDCQRYTLGDHTSKKHNCCNFKMLFKKDFSEINSVMNKKKRDTELIISQIEEVIDLYLKKIQSVLKSYLTKQKRIANDVVNFLELIINFYQKEYNEPNAYYNTINIKDIELKKINLPTDITENSYEDIIQFFKYNMVLFKRKIEIIAIPQQATQQQSHTPINSPSKDRALTLTPVKQFIPKPITPMKREKFFKTKVTSLVVFKNITSCKDAQIIVISILADGNIAGCSKEGKIKIYNKDSFKEIKELEGHTKVVTYISQVNEEKYASCSFDKTIRIWNFTTDECETVFEGHEDVINKVIPLGEGIIGSCSNDHTVRLWDIDNKKCYRVITTHEDWVITIAHLKNSTVFFSVSTFKEKKLIKWDFVQLNFKQINNKIYACNNNSILELKEKSLIVGGFNVIFIIEIKNLALLKEIKFGNDCYVTSFLIFGETIMFSCGKSIYALEEEDFSYKSLVQGGEENINCIIKLNNTQIAACNNSSVITIFGCS